MPEPVTVCVYCASSDIVDARYREIAADLGAALAAEGWPLVYGGGNVGLMGEVARAALAGGGRVTGIIPERLVAREVALSDVTELVQTRTMRERKDLMDRRSDAFIVLPGGIGTLEELVEILTLKQLGYHDRAVVLVDAEGYWDPLVAQLRQMVQRRFAHPSLLDLWTVAADAAGAVSAVRAHRPGRVSPTTGEELEATEAPPVE